MTRTIDETVRIDELTEKTTLANDDLLLLQDANGNGKKVKGDKIAKSSDLTSLATKTELAGYVKANRAVLVRADTIHEGGQIDFERADSTKNAIALDVYNDNFRIFSTEGVGFNIDFNAKVINSFGKNLATSDNFVSTTIVITPDSNGVYRWQHNKGIKYNNISLTLQSSDGLSAYLWDESNENVAVFLFHDRVGNPINHAIRVGLFALN